MLGSWFDSSPFISTVYLVNDKAVRILCLFVKKKKERKKEKIRIMHINACRIYTHTHRSSQIRVTLKINS